MWMAWGPELTFLCNDAYRRDTLGRKYPWALGRPAREVWAEIWPEIGPRITTVIETGEATWDEWLMLILERSGYPEETYHTFSYSPLPDDEGHVAGMLCVVSEETKRMIGERRMATLSELGSLSTGVREEPEFLAAAGEALASNRLLAAVHDRLPVRGGRQRAPGRLQRDRGRPRGGAGARRRSDRARAWPLTSWRSGRVAVVAGDRRRVRPPAHGRLGRAAGRGARCSPSRSPATSGRTGSSSSASTATRRSSSTAITSRSRSCSSSTWRPASPGRGPMRPSASAPSSSRSSTAPRRRSSPTSATSSARR